MSSPIDRLATEPLGAQPTPTYLDLTGPLRWTWKFQQSSHHNVSCFFCGKIHNSWNFFKVYFGMSLIIYFLQIGRLKPNHCFKNKRHINRQKTGHIHLQLEARDLYWGWCKDTLRRVVIIGLRLNRDKKKGTRKIHMVSPKWRFWEMSLFFPNGWVFGSMFIFSGVYSLWLLDRISFNVSIQGLDLFFIQYFWNKFYLIVTRILLCFVWVHLGWALCIEV